MPCKKHNNFSTPINPPGKVHLKTNERNQYSLSICRFPTIRIQSKAPSYIFVGPGLNLRGTCENKKCEAFNKVIWIQKGMNQFDIGEEVFKANCPICPTTDTALKIDNLGFYYCIYTIKGIQSQPQIKHVEKKKSHCRNK